MQLAADIDAVKMQTLQLCGHAPHVERPEATRAALVQLLRDLELLDVADAHLKEEEFLLMDSRV